MVNGYVTLDLASNKIYKESLGAIKSGKPVMVVDAPNVYFADTISVVSDDVVITKGGKTITINDANAVSSEGEIQKHLWHYTICRDTVDYGFTIDLPFDLGKNNVTINDDDSLNENKDFIQKLIDLLGIGKNTMFEGFSDDTSNCLNNVVIFVTLSNLKFKYTNVAFSDGSDSIATAQINLTNGKVTSFNSGEIQIYRNYQIY